MRVFIGQEAMHIDREHQQNKPNKGVSEKTESNKKGHAREETVLKDKHIRKNIPTLYTSGLQRIQFNRQSPPTSDIKMTT
jgi:predicted metal-dependent hydrolase